MSTQAQRSIGEHIRRIAGAMPAPAQIMSGVVKEVNEAEGTAMVALSLDGDEAVSGVMLNAIIENDNGLLVIPAQDSNVWVAEIDGPDKWGIIKCSNAEKVTIKIAGTPEVLVESGKVVINGGEHGGMVKVQELVEAFNVIREDVNRLKNKIGIWSPVPNDGGAALRAALAESAPGVPPLPTSWAGELIQEFTIPDFENPDAKH